MLFYVFSKHISHLCESSELLDVADGGKTESGEESLPPHLFCPQKSERKKKKGKLCKGKRGEANVKIATESSSSEKDSAD